MSIVDSAVWSEILPYIRVEEYVKDRGHSKPRFRIEIKDMNDIPVAVREKALDLELPCPHCATPVNPIRVRRTRQGKEFVNQLYFAPCCPTDENEACSRSPAARAEYYKVRDAVPRTQVLALSDKDDLLKDLAAYLSQTAPAGYQDYISRIEKALI